MCISIYLVGKARSCLVIGEIQDRSDINGPGVPPGEIDDKIAIVLENQLGVGWTRELRRADLDLRLLWETQFWMNDTFADDLNGIGSNIAFSGLTASAELRY